MPASRLLGQQASASDGGFRFVQISDSHIGFAKEPNQNVVGTLEETVARINALPQAPALVLHTGDLTHLAKPEEFDTCQEVLKKVKESLFFRPGSHMEKEMLQMLVVVVTHIILVEVVEVMQGLAEPVESNTQDVLDLLQVTWLQVSAEEH